MTELHQDGRAGIDAALVRRLIAQQFPQWADLPVTPVAVDGWDNRTYRLGPDLTARLPTHESYVAAVDKEHQWLPVLAPLLPVEIPTAVAKGAPGEGYPHPWAIRRWISGTTASPESVADLEAFAREIAEFVRGLQSVDATGGPLAGAHSFYRGASLENYHDETVDALAVLKGRIDADLSREVWDAALAASWDGPPVWFHGDIAAGNLLVRDGRLSAVIDFGTSGVGDPACDLVIAYGFFSGSSRAAFRDAVRQDDATWARARGWALWKALITDSLPIVEAVLADHVTQTD
ncbi:aminoglycoside phosphotransferase (APT) family kinase protein [Kribbella aluminosa]|uniref:Aminoglycoside phosphotransferase (APT) family kinase protein n=1 Tax=Kribbella aluminosa TaxID=416017 RepID=A0ABS4UXC5_9ACTN|nr:aminoglycoside phosphotransferase family protein [Kribbella aluminosa]MBP2356273.1 aminoglycoside phosphotransferase (APT) family kinase protein [Kribbella aluminosa]